MKILVEIKNNYGSEAIYPLCSQGRIFADIAGTKTLTRKSLDQIKALGYSVELQQQTL